MGVYLRMACWLAAALFLFAPATLRAQYGSAVKLANLADTRVRESSGLATSLRYPDSVSGVLWTHNDSGNAPYLFATDRTGKALACFEVVGATNVDWEDVAEGPGYIEPDGSYARSLYIADIGDNAKSRSDLSIYRVREPDVYAARPYPQVSQTDPAEKFPFVYPNGAHYDAETLLVHPKTGDVYIVTKDSGGTSRVFRFPWSLVQRRPRVTVTLEEVGRVQFTGLLSVSRTVTGGDIAPDGSKLVMRTYTQAHEWPIHPRQTVAQALRFNVRRSFALPLEQGEAICYRPDGRALLLTSEASPCPLYELPPG